MRRAAAAFFCFWFVAAFLASASYVAYRSAHKCSGDGCGTCCQIVNVVLMGAQPKTSPPALPAVPPVFSLFGLSLLLPLFSKISPATPVTLKVKISC